jgi:hypothetical protein
VRLAIALLAFATVLPQPSACVLRRSDLGRAFAGRGAPLGSHGYEIVFTRLTGSLQDGPLEVQSSATVYPSASAAHTAFVSRHRLPVGYVRLQLGFSVGQEARQWVRQGEAGVGTVLQYMLLWREGDVDASIVITGRVGVVSAADVAPLARRQEARIRAAL